jgi:hypothetical protein
VTGSVTVQTISRLLRSFREGGDAVDAATATVKGMRHIGSTGSRG